MNALPTSLVAALRPLRTYASWDLALGFAAGLVTWRVAQDQDVIDQGVTVLLAIAALGGAFVATVFAGLAILVTQFDGPYREILERAHPDGVRATLRPYLAVAKTSAVAAGLALIGAVLWAAFSSGLAEIVLAAAAAAAVWSLVGMVQLVDITIGHVHSRTSVERALEQAAKLPARPRVRRGTKDHANR